MSNALAIAGVTAVLRDLLDSGLIDHEVTDAMGQGVTVSAVAPDTIRIEGTEARPQLNVFMHQATPNAALRNVDLPSRNRDGHRLSNPPLALDLHYLVTAYGVSDLQAEVLLGYAMQLLHETPVLVARRDPHRAQPAERAGRRRPAADRVRGAARIRSGRAVRADQDHAGTDEHRGDVEAVVGDPGALPADGRLPGVGGADRVDASGARAAAGAHPRAARAFADRSRRGPRARRCGARRT